MNQKNTWICLFWEFHLGKKEFKKLNFITTFSVVLMLNKFAYLIMDSISEVKDHSVKVYIEVIPHILGEWGYFFKNCLIPSLGLFFLR